MLLSAIVLSMSRAFVNEDNQEEAPLIPPRAPLPEGATNYVTAKGMDLLRIEHKGLSDELETLHALEDSKEKRYKLQLVKGKLSLLEERIGSARILKIGEQDKSEVRFGATVTVRFIQENRNQTFQIVGVDEADIKLSKIAFTAPIAIALNGKSIGDQVPLKLGLKERPMTVLDIRYDH